MSKYTVYGYYTETRSIEVEADSEEEAVKYAEDHLDEMEPNGDDDIRFESEETTE